MDKKNKHGESDYLWRGRFLAGWLCASIVVWPLSLVVGLIFSGLLGTISGNRVLLQSSIPALPIILIGLALGISVGWLQEFVLARTLSRVSHLFKASIAGGVAGTLTVALLTNTLVATGIKYPIQDFLMMPLFVTILSAFQWFVLRRVVSEAWKWILANLAGGLAFSVCLSTSDPFIIFFGILAQGMITGLAILWLFQYRAYPQKSYTNSSISPSPSTIP